MRLAAMLPLLLACSTVAHAADKVIGLLAMPEVFWEERGPCDDQFKPRKVLLYSAPRSSDAIGDIRVDRASSPSDVPCSVNVHLRRDGAISELPTDEYAYEQRAAIVLNRRARWFKVRLAGGAAWVHASSEDRFLALEYLLWEHRDLIGATEFWDRRLAAGPGGSLRPLPSDPRRHLVGYLTPVLTEITLELRSGEDPETVARRYPNSGWGSASHRDGTVTLYVHTPIEVEALERPEALAPVVLRFRNDEPVLSGTYTPKLFVFDRRSGWFQVRRRGEEYQSQRWRTEQTLWLRESPAWEFTPVTNEAERHQLADEAWGPEYGDNMRVARLERVGDHLWAEVELLDHSYCDGTGDPTVLMRGWMPVHDRAGEPTIRFYSRGC
jgi:hypothetical protein